MFNMRQANISITLTVERLHKASENIVESLEELLQQARSGELVGLSWAYVDSIHGRLWTGWAVDTFNARNGSMLLAATDQLHHRMLNMVTPE